MSEVTLGGSYCSLCNELLSDSNNSDEHIIPNAIGGRMTVRGFICRSCNNISGRNWDQALAEQFSDFSVLIGVKRQRGSVPPIKFETKEGRSVALNVDGKMSSLCKAKVTDNVGPHGGSVNIQAATDEQANRISEGIVTKYKKQGAKSVLLKRKEETVNISEVRTVQASFGGDGSGKSYVKTAMAMAAKQGLFIEDCECVKEYLINDGNPCFGYYYGDDVLGVRPDIFHMVALEGKPKEKLLLAYIEYFSFFRIIVCLSENYMGERFKKSYAIDPRVGGELNVDFSLSLTECDIDKLYSNGFYDGGVLKSSLLNVLMLIQGRSEKLELNRNIETVCSQAMKELGVKEGDVLKEEDYRRFSALVANKMTIYFAQGRHHRQKMTEELTSDDVPKY